LTVEVAALNLHVAATVALTVMVWLSAAYAVPLISRTAPVQAAAMSFLVVLMMTPFSSLVASLSEAMSRF
jgi:hypothetical protein